MKRYQDCNGLQKVWRRRWYITAPFIWIWRSTVTSLKVYKDETKDGKIIHTNEYFIPKGKLLWDLIIGEIDCKMNYYWTSEEMEDKIYQIFKNGRH